MNFLRKLLLGERRHDSLENPRVSFSAGITALIESWGGSVKSGQQVNAHTALQLPVVHACVRVLAESVASIPLPVYRRKGKGKERATDHPAYRVLHDRANTEQPSFMWRETLMAHLCLNGNAYSEKEYDGAGRLIGLWPIRPDRVRVERKNGVKLFHVEGVRHPIGAESIMHIPGLGYDGMVGYSPIHIAREAIGLGLAAQEYGAGFFANGANPGGVIEHPNKLGPDAIKNLRASWVDRHAGAGNAHKPAILEEGMKWNQISISNRDSQFLETRKYQATDIAGIFRVPPHMVGNLDRATFSNIEQQSIDFVVHTLRPWCVRIEQVLNWELFDESEREEYFAEFNVDGLLRGDSAARGAFYTQMFNVGVLSINDIREKENLNPVEGGDKRFVPLNMATLEMAGVIPEPAPVKAFGNDEGQPKEDDARRALAAFQPMVRDVLERGLMREKTAAVRASKRGLLGFRAWLVEYQDDQAEYMKRGLMPIAMGALAMLGKTGDDMRAVGDVVAGEIASHVRAYRSLQEPSEQVVTEMLARLGGDAIDATAREMTDRLIGALVGPRALRAAVGAPIVNISLPAHHTQVHQPNIHLSVANEQPKIGTRTVGKSVRQADGSLVMETTVVPPEK